MSRGSEHPIARKLKENRRRIRQMVIVSQTQLAQRMDMDPSLLSHVLAGRRPAPEGFYESAAAVLGCAVNELMSIEDSAAA